MRHCAILSFLVFLVARVACAQWIDERAGESDRPHPRHDRSIRTLAIPPPEDPLWPFPNINVIHSVPFYTPDQTEPSIAINPLDSLNIIIGANDDRSDTTLYAYATTDGGMSWSNLSLPPEKSFTVYATDPSVMFDRGGNPLFGTGHYRDNNQCSDVACYRSTDKGETWGRAGTPYSNTDFGNDTTTDKYYFAVDGSTSSPFKDRIYAVWVEYASTPGARIVCSFSDDDGYHWSKRIYLSDLGYFTAPVPATAPDGTLIVTFENYKFGQESILCVHSTDGGMSFTAPQVISRYSNLGAIEPIGDQNGYQILKNDLMVNSFPSIAIDGSGRHSGRTYVTWCGIDAGNRARVFMSTSNDGGKQWSTPRPVDCDSSELVSDKFFPWVAVDPITGDVGIAYNDSRLDPNNVLTDLFMSFSTDGGDSFTSHRISSMSCDPRQGQDIRSAGNLDFRFFGDYLGIAGRAGNWYPTWTDARVPGDLDVYTAAVQPFAPMPVANLIATDTTVNGVTTTLLKWDYKPETTFGFPLPDNYYFSITRDSVLVQTIPANGRTVTVYDTGSSGGHKFGVTVISGSMRSRTAWSDTRKGGVGRGTSFPQRSVLLVRSNQNGGAGCTLLLHGGETAKVSLSIYDEFGRVVAMPLSDEPVSSEQEVQIPLGSAGVRFYVLREESPGNVARVTVGKFIVESR